MFTPSPRHKEERFYRTRWNTELTMRAHGFVNLRHALFERKHVQWTQCNACTAAKTSVFVHDERFVWTPSHGTDEDREEFGVFVIEEKHFAHLTFMTEPRCETP